MADCRTHDDGVRAKNRLPGAMDFPTKSALVLSAVTLAGLFLLSAIYSEPSAATDRDPSYQSRRLEHLGSYNGTDYSTHSCNYIYEVTPDAGDAQCAFAKTCNQGAGVWAPSVFCSDHFSRTFLCIILSPFMLLWLVLLFRMLGSTAEDYFSPALEMFSTKLGLPPRFAGVTLLALGNGAADVSAAVSSITSDPVAGYKMSLGALTGAAMVISSVISAAVILAADGVPCRGALVRDGAALVVTVVIVWSELASGTMGPESVSLFLSLYAIFVLLVLSADVYHRAVVLPRLAALAGEAELERQLQAADEILPAVAASPPLQQQQQNSSRLGIVLTALSNYDAPNESGQAPGQGWGVESEDLAHDRPIQLHGQGGILGRQHHHGHGTPSSVEQDPNNSYAVLEDAVDHTCVQTGTYGTTADSWQEAVDDGKDELVQHAANIWDDIMYDGDVHPISKFLLLCELPLTFMRQITVPIPCEGYYCRALVALSLAVSPLWFVYYLWSGKDVNMLSGDRWPFFVVFELAVCAFALCILRFAPGGNGEMSLAFSTPIALYGFVVAATWIDTIADALVSLLNFVGIILRIPGPVIGLTILAWGNSMGDLSANITMARKGLANMAMTACFAGPVFNILVGLGLGFGSLAAQSGNAETKVSLSPSVVTGFVFIALNALALLATGLGFGKGFIPKQFGYLALTVYSIYLVTSISLQYSKYGDGP